MSMTIDNLRVDHRVTILQDFSDAAGTVMRAGETGLLRGLSFDQLGQSIHMRIEPEAGVVSLVFSLRATSGPRNGHMREYFEVGDYVPVPGTERVFHDPASRTMIVRKSLAPEPTYAADAPWPQPGIEGPDRLEDMEQEMRKRIDHIGVASSIAEIYANRMRAFQRAGNEPRAAAAFKLAVEWMWTYAGWATSGGEGAANSYEAKLFQASLVREFGYDPTEKPKS